MLEPAQVLAVVKAVSDVLDETREQARAALVERLGAGGRVKARFDGADVATITVSDPKPAVTVTDRDAFLDWVRVNVPSAVEERVRPKDQASILAAALTTGELPDGCDLTQGSPVCSVRMSAEQAAALREALTAGAFDFSDALALERST